MAANVRQLASCIFEGRPLPFATLRWRADTRGCLFYEIYIDALYVSPSVRISAGTRIAICMRLGLVLIYV